MYQRIKYTRDRGIDGVINRYGTVVYIDPVRRLCAHEMYVVWDDCVSNGAEKCFLLVEWSDHYFVVFDGSHTGRKFYKKKDIWYSLRRKVRGIFRSVRRKKD